MARPLGKPSDKADCPDKPRPVRVAAKCGICIVALLGFVVLATTFVARLASIRILPATQSAEGLIRGSNQYIRVIWYPRLCSRLNTPLSPYK